MEDVDMGDNFQNFLYAVLEIKYILKNSLHLEE